MTILSYNTTAPIALAVLLTACSDGGVPLIGPTNMAPVADAGVDQTVNEEVLVQVDAAGSTDGDGSITSTVWSQLTGFPHHPQRCQRDVTDLRDAQQQCGREPYP